MKKFILYAGFLAVCAQNVYADEYDDEFIQQSVTSTVFTEIPVRSYYAYPDDPNFIPETEFMNMDDDVDYDEVIYNVRTEEAMANPGVQFTERPTIICRDFNCTRLNNRITRTFLFNSLSNMFLTNMHSRLYICEADPFSRSCLQSGISFPVRSGIANALVKIPKATISQVNLSTGLSRATATVNYEFLINGVKRTCEPTIMDIAVPNNTQATLINREFSCNLTSDGNSSVSILINLDYIDLDYGILGGYYSIGTQGSTSGGGTGYALFKTEYSTRGMNFRASARGTKTPVQNATEQESSLTIQPGEYAVEPLN